MGLKFLPTTFLIYESVTSGSAALYRVFWLYMIVAGLVFVIICSVIGYLIMRYRAQEGADDPPQNHGNRKVEMTLTLMTAGVGIFLFYLTLSTMLDVNKPVEDQEPDLVVTGHQWWWEVEYPGENVTTANEIHIPTDKELIVELQTADVIHSFWVPALGRKMDLVSGNKSYLRFNVEKPGTYQGTCSEFCGAQHAWMRIKVVAQPEEEFDRWIAENSQPASMPEDSLAVTGRNVFDRLTCGNCHSIEGTEADGEIGPDLTHLGSRETLLAGRFENTPENLHRWLSDPQKVKPGAHMPKYILPDQQVSALVSYLEGLE